jgi:calcineurin-like phosphoesterase family protein
MTKTYFTSDTHYGHRNIIKYCNRPFESVEEMDEEMIRRWNEVVGPQDHVYHLGDFAMGKVSAPGILSRLNGHKHLIWGNHDSPQIRSLPQWASSQAYHELRLDGQFIILCHYKFDVFNKSHHGAIQFFGHSHGSMPGNNQQIDCGVDCWDYRPVDLQTLLDGMRKLPPFRDKDHHKKREAY